MTNSDSLLVIATGSSASITLPSYLAELRERVSLKVVVLMTETAIRFVRPEVVGWFAHSVLTPTMAGLNPIELACSSSAIIVLPASGNTLAAAALGLMATPATTVLAAAPGPCLFFPHLHHTVWRKPFLQRHVAELREQGHRVVDPQPLETFQISAQRQVLTLSMPPPDVVAATIDAWLQE
jgi:phosphopantothenoylcysteine decarboxylase/phosphopantothenate--cysteine ligase